MDRHGLRPRDDELGADVAALRSVPQELRIAAMTFTDMLRDAERQHDSMLCVGLDPDPAKFPTPYRGDASKIGDFCCAIVDATACLLYTSPSPRDRTRSRMPSSA